MDNQTQLKAALYIRVSTEEQAQDGQSASAQAETLKQYCHAFRIEIADVYMDLGLSGKSLKERSELKRLIKDCGNGRFGMVLVWKISRLSRNLKDLLYLIDIFEKNNVYFASCSEKFDTSTPVGRMTLQLLGSIAEFERNTIVENVKLGLREFARKGGKATSLLGYDNADKKLRINEREAGIVKMIFNLRTVSGMSFSAIAQYLNSLGFRTKRGSEFRSSSIAYVLHNPVYIGINRHGKNTGNEYCIDGAHPAIIDAETWNNAQSINTKPYGRISSISSTDSSAFPVTCMLCKSPMKVFYAYSKGKKYKYMRCSSCSNYINFEKLEKVIYQEIIAIINNESKQGIVYNLMNSRSHIDEASCMEISSIMSEISRLLKSKARYLGLFESYKLSDTKVFVDRIAEIEAQIKALEQKRLELGRSPFSTQSSDIDNYFDRLRAGLSEQKPDLMKQMSEALIKSIEIYKGEIKIVLYL